MARSRSTFQLNPAHVVLFFAVLFVVLMPMVRLISIGIAHIAGLAFMLSVIGGFLVVEMLRASSGNVLTFDGTRKSRQAADSMIVSGDDEIVPGMAFITYNGIRSLAFASADNSVFVAPASAVEWLNDSTVIIYSPCVPLRRPEALNGLFPSECDMLSKSQDTRFDAKGKHSEVRFSLLNTLLRSPTSEDLRRSQLFVDRSAMEIAADRDKATLGAEANIKELRRLASAVRKDSMWTSFKNLFAGKDEDRPPEGPYKGEG